MFASYLHNVETDGSICGWFHAGMLTLDNQPEHTPDSTQTLWTALHWSHCGLCIHYGMDMDLDNFVIDKLGGRKKTTKQESLLIIFFRLDKSFTEILEN